MGARTIISELKERKATGTGGFYLSPKPAPNLMSFPRWLARIIFSPFLLINWIAEKFINKLLLPKVSSATKLSLAQKEIADLRKQNEELLRQVGRRGEYR